METIENLTKFTVPQLRTFLEQRGQSSEGLKKDMFERAVSVWKTENSDTTTEKTPAEVGAGDVKVAVTTATTQAPVSQLSAHMRPMTAAYNCVAGVNYGQTSEHGRQPKDEDYSRSDYEVDAHKLWLDQRVRAIEERDKIHQMHEDLEEQAWRMRRDEEDRRRDEEKRQRSERTAYLRRRRELEKQRLLYLADAEATGLLRPDSKVGLGLTLPDLPVAEAKVIVFSSVLPDVDASI